MFATYLMFVHNPAGLWEITVEQSSPVTMLHVAIIRKKPLSQKNRRSSEHVPKHKPFQSKTSQAGNTVYLPLCALLRCSSGTCKPRLQKGKRAENVIPQIRSFTDRLFSTGMLSSSLLILLAAVRGVSFHNGKIHKAVGS